MMATRSSLICILLALVGATWCWSGNYDSRTICRYVYRRVCAYRTWSACCRYKTIQEPAYYTQYFCKPGWRHNGNQNCNIAICIPSCNNGGTCVRPNKCQCTGSYTGPSCEGRLCSHLKPCYPGKCTRSLFGGNSVCECSVGFHSESNGCQGLLQPYETPEIYQCQITLTNYKQSKQMVMYELLLDTSADENLNTSKQNSADEIWTNRLLFNQIYYTGIAFYDPNNLPPVPETYISSATFGIVGGVFKTKHNKVDGRITDNPFGTIRCPDASSSAPINGMFNCSVNNTIFDTRIDSGDIITMTFTAQAGGNRRLINIDTKRPYRTHYYAPRSISKTLKFRFDAMKPIHCFSFRNCSNNEKVLNFGPEYTKNPSITLLWNGWEDQLSGVLRYAWEVFQLRANGDGELREPEPLKPITIDEVEHSSNIAYPTYTFPNPGLYSIILQIADRANNSEYVRRFVLHDPDSQILISDDLESSLRVTSSSRESNYTWQADVSGTLSVKWTGFFYNKLVEDQQLLNTILDYPVQFIEEGATEMKKVLDMYKNTDGRTQAPVPNARGITAFQLAHHKDITGGSSKPSVPTAWIDLGTATTYDLQLPVDSGETVVIWIKAIDPLGRERIEETLINFDTTSPLVTSVDIVQVDGSTRIKGVAKDMESGILLVDWRTVRTDTDIEYASGTIPWPQVPVCSDVRECMCLEKFSQCFKLAAELDISTCDMKLSDSDLSVEIKLFITIRNQAMVGKEHTFTVEDIKTLSGYSECFPVSDSGGLSGGAIAGIIIGILLVIIIGVLVFLFVTGRRPFTPKRKERGSMYFQNIFGKQTNHPAPTAPAYPNGAYAPDVFDNTDDEVYLYGGKDYDNATKWQILGDDLTLLGKITDGHFAQISQAKVKGRSETVVAKMLPAGFTPDDAMLMKAKINFMISEVEPHPNVLKLLGAVIDNVALGPVMILEYCESGRLDKWLVTQRGQLSQDIMEMLQQMAFGICKGMTHLASLKIVHKKLSSRNVLLTFTRVPMITGFGPSKALENDDPKAKQRIPIRWTAPECMTSLKDATLKSDVWSFGVVLWEIFSLGQQPYSDLDMRSIEKKVKAGYRMSKPEMCEDFYYAMMSNCWQENPKKRESFKKICEKISDTFTGKPTDGEYYYR